MLLTTYAVHVNYVTYTFVIMTNHRIWSIYGIYFLKNYIHFSLNFWILFIYIFSTLHFLTRFSFNDRIQLHKTHTNLFWIVLKVFTCHSTSHAAAIWHSGLESCSWHRNPEARHPRPGRRQPTPPRPRRLCSLLGWSISSEPEPTEP